MRYQYAIISIGLLCIIPILTNAQKCGSGTISQASQYYEVGQFDRVVNSLAPCLKNGFSENTQQIEGYVLMAKTFVALDSIPTAEEYIRKLISLDPTFQTRPDEPIVFRALVYKAKNGQLGNNVSSVSKVSESLFEAPATVILITEQQIKQRGYTDLEMLLHDLPGFDITQTNGVTYSSIYQRGYRSDNTNRMLLLVDGVEDNDLWGNIVFLSRQYQMSNISSIEVVYGPASTIYGPNAFVGVISINTKQPIEFISENQNIGLAVETGYGQWNSRFIDATIAAKVPNQPIAFSVTGRYFYSDEPDFSEYHWLDYAPLSLDAFDNHPSRSTVMDSMNLLMSISGDSLAKEFLRSANGQNSAFYQAVIENGDTTGVMLTEAGIRRALELDNELWNNASYHDRTDLYSISAKLNIHELTIGWQYWQKKEGIGAWYNDTRRGTTAQGQSWNPNSNMFYLKYNKELTPKVSFKAFARYKEHGYLPDNALVNSRTYMNGGLGLENLIQEDTTYWDKTYLAVHSNQIRAEFTTIYRINPNWNMFAGFEGRFSSIQANYITGSEPNPESTSYPDSILGGNHFFSQDIGFYAQTNYSIPQKHLKITGGLRFDYNSIRHDGGYGAQLNPRLAIVYYPENWVFKGVFARAFKAPTNFDLYSTVSGVRDTSNAGLRPESSINYEFSIRRFITPNFNVELVGYFTDYNNTIQSDTVTTYGHGLTTQFQSSGNRQVFGGHIMATYTQGNWSGYFNYTYTDPFNLLNISDFTGQADSFLLVGDISLHQINLGGNYRWKDFNLNLRMNWPGYRFTGEFTTVPDNIYTFPAIVVFNGAASWKVFNTGLHLDLMVNNILNTEYFSPGVRTAGDVNYNSRIPQKRRNFMFRMRYNF